MKPLVSILIPAYNAESWVADTIRSAMAQTWEPKEIIVLDDGSKDRTYEVAKEFESEKVHVFKQENTGVPTARNNLFSMSHGEFIQWLDADDLLAPDKIERQMKMYEQQVNNPRMLLSSPFGAFLHRPQHAKFIPSDLWYDLDPKEFLIRKLGQKLSLQTSTWLVSRELTEAAGPWDPLMYVNNDGEYFSRVILKSQGVKFVPDANVYYRSVGAGSVSYIGRSNKKMEALWRGLQLHIGYLRGLEDSERVRAACVKYLEHYLIDFYPLRMDIVEKVQKLAKELGGNITEPPLSWKYRWIRAVFGWNAAHRAFYMVPEMKWSLKRRWDKLAFDMENRQSQPTR